MVSITTNKSDFLLPDVYRSLVEQLKNLNPDDVEKAFVIWMFDDVVEKFEFYFPVGIDITDYRHVGSHFFSKKLQLFTKTISSNLKRD
jgi:hypothetical protein